MEINKFKERHTFYKHNKDTFQSVIDLRTTDIFMEKVQIKDKALLNVQIPQYNLSELGLIPANQWKIVELKDHEGCYLIENPFNNAGQRMWLRECLEIYPQLPNKNNTGFEFNSFENPWTQLNATNEKEIKKSKLSKIHWVTLGYHHNWDTKEYDLANVSEFPENLSKLTRCIADRLGWSQFRPEAAIVNYYSTSSSIGGHTDHSEYDQFAPLISISFGLTAVFLLGGRTKETKPSAIFIRSGDIMVMSGSSRLAYHSVPRILPSSYSSWEKTVEDSPNDAVDKYTQHFRVNINVRQVFKYENC